MTPGVRAGFVGLGTMGLPMATRLLDAGVPLAVWNRTRSKSASLAARGAVVEDSIDALCARCDVLLVMLLDQQAVDAAFGRGADAFARRVAGRTLVLLGSTSPDWSQAFGEDVRACGGRHVEAPVSGSRGPAEAGALIGMVAGDPDDIARVSPLLAPLCRQVVACGAVPRALQLKLAVNHYLIVLVAALAEAVRAAEAVGVDMALFRTVLDAGPMASDVSRAKLAKLVVGDHAPQAAIRDVAQIAALVADQARGAAVDAPLIDASAELFRLALARGLGTLDMAAVLQPSRDVVDPPAPVAIGAPD
ncbi:MAG: NAD(P)-dependent oxidoreductase [Xanthomonadales bacterium]|nr:NAD(P)-dependent oxidoreductase [Xanthomonadales bacterium]